MKTIAKQDWEKVPESEKKIYDGIFYMVYKETDGRTCFGPVKVIEEEHDKIDSISLNNNIQKEM